MSGQQAMHAAGGRSPGYGCRKATAAFDTASGAPAEEFSTRNGQSFRIFGDDDVTAVNHKTDQLSVLLCPTENE
jgi:hypothetical protein